MHILGFSREKKAQRWVECEGAVRLEGSQLTVKALPCTNAGEGRPKIRTSKLSLAWEFEASQDYKRPCLTLKELAR